MYENDCRVVHETILKDIVDVLTDIKDIDEIEFELGKNKSFKSIASASSNLTLVFPVVVSSDMDINTAMMISKAIERKCVAMLQMLFSAFTIDNAKDAIEYVSKFHTNMKMTDRMDFDSFVSYVDNFANKLDEDAPITVDMYKYEAVREDMKNNMNYYLDLNCVNESSINDYTIMPATIAGSRTVIKEANDRNEEFVSKFTDTLSTKLSSKLNGFRSNAVKAVQNDSKTRSEYNKNSAEYFNKQIIPTEIKKANELMPTMMVINFITPGQEGGDAIRTSAVIGVKAKMYPVTSMDIIDRLRSKNKDNNSFNNFIRATTREISFWKDFVFAIDKAKIDALSSSKRGSSSSIWKLLERRALKSRIRRTFRMTNDATAITTLVMSLNEVEWLKKNDNMDMLNPYTARSIMESFNLMSISIVDESVEVARFIFDTGDDDYESITFSALERESSDSTYKRVVNLMTKMSR